MYSKRSPKLSIGRTVHHKMFDYRGMILGVDEVFKGSDECYAIVAGSRPAKNTPWYHLLVRDSSDRTCGFQRNLEPDESDQPISHPQIYEFFLIR
jgi:heat shock protein HspQ